MGKKIYRDIEYSPMNKWYTKWRKDALDNIKSKVKIACDRLDCEFVGVLTTWGGNVPGDHDDSFIDEKYETWLEENAVGKYFFYSSFHIMFELKEDAVGFRLTWL